MFNFLEVVNIPKDSEKCSEGAISLLCKGPGSV